MEHKHMVVPFEMDLKSFDEEEGIFKGYASVFGNEDSHGDVMMKGAFTNSLKDTSRVKILKMHKMNELPIGKPIRMFEDEKGLFVEGKISDTTDGRDVKALIKDGVFTELSIGYIPLRDRFNEKKQRELLEVEVFEFSPVTLASNDKALISSYKKLEGGEGVSKEEDEEEEEKVKVDDEDEEEKATKNPERMKAAFAKMKEGMAEIEAIMGSSKAEDEDEEEEEKADDITEEEKNMLFKNITRMFTGGK